MRQGAHDSPPDPGSGCVAAAQRGRGQRPWFESKYNKFSTSLQSIWEEFACRLTMWQNPIALCPFSGNHSGVLCGAGFRRTGISPGPLIHPIAGICWDFVTFTCTYRILSGECALSRRSSASLQRCLQFGSFVRVAGTPLTGNVKL